jgi:hypothetical protein
VLSKDGQSVSWTDQRNEQGGTGSETCSLQMSGPNAAYYRENAVFSSADGSGSINATGTLIKR